MKVLKDKHKNKIYYRVGNDKHYFVVKTKILSDELHSNIAVVAADDYVDNHNGSRSDWPLLFTVMYIDNNKWVKHKTIITKEVEK